MQHDKGICTLLNLPDRDQARETLTKLATRYVSEWATEVLAAHLGVASLRDADPGDIRAWAFMGGVRHLLPPGE
jgi:N-acetyl-anhydromuramyl-L-alanine amidase AmpD